MRALVELTFVLALLMIAGAAAEPVASPDYRLTVEHREGARYAGIARDGDGLLITNLADGRLYRRDAAGRILPFGPVLPHGMDAFGDPTGPYRVVRDGASFIVAQGWTPASQAAGPLDHALLRISDAGKVMVISNDLWNPYDFAIAGESFIVVDAARNSLERVSSSSGARETVFVFKRLKTDGAALKTLSPTEFADKQAVEFDAVPTGIAAHEGRLHVSLFGGFPFLPGSGRVVSLPDSGTPTAARIEADNLNAPVDIAFAGPDAMLVVEHGTFGQATGWTAGSGRLLRIDLAIGKREILLEGLTRPVSALVFDSRLIVVSDLDGNLHFLDHR
ncbi:MAG: ScyD/ScyE family protein [Aestuariivirgaceae bacterium]